MSPQVPPPRRTLTGLGDSDPNELAEAKRMLRETRARADEDRARATEERFVGLEDGVQELRDADRSHDKQIQEIHVSIAEFKAMGRAWMIAVSAFWALIVAAGAMWIKFSTH